MKTMSGPWIMTPYGTAMASFVSVFTVDTVLVVVVVVVLGLVLVFLTSSGLASFGLIVVGSAAGLESLLLVCSCLVVQLEPVRQLYRHHLHCTKFTRFFQFRLIVSVFAF